MADEVEDKGDALEDMKCPSCGSTELRQDTDGVWHCLYCRATFRADRPMMIVVDSPNVQQADEVVIDTADLLTFDQQKAVSEHFARIRADHDVVVALETVNTITENVEYYARSRAQELGVGDDAKDNGIYILMVRSPRRVQVQAGNGISQHLGGADIDRIVGESFVPAFKRGDLVAGLTEGADALVAAYEENRRTGSSGTAATGPWRAEGSSWSAPSSSSGSSRTSRFSRRSLSEAGGGDSGGGGRGSTGTVIFWIALVAVILFVLMNPSCAQRFTGGGGGGGSDSGWTSDDSGWDGGSDWGGGGDGGGGSFDGGDFDGGSGGGSDW